MSTATLIKVIVVFYGLALVLTALAAHAQDAPAHLPTIADCPAGYTLGVQDTDEPLIAARQPDPNAGYSQNNQEAVNALQQRASAPRQFVTGCIPPKSKQQ